MFTNHCLVIFFFFFNQYNVSLNESLKKYCNLAKAKPKLRVWIGVQYFSHLLKFCYLSVKEVCIQRAEED